MMPIHRCNRDAVENRVLTWWNDPYIIFILFIYLNKGIALALYQRFVGRVDVFCWVITLAGIMQCLAVGGGGGGVGEEGGERRRGEEEGSGGNMKWSHIVCT